jgi:para-nitrobenzyl esterase
MQGYFANFVKTGNPNGPGLPHWPVGTVASDGRVMRMRLDVESHAEAEQRARFLFLDQFYAQQQRK